MIDIDTLAILNCYCEMEPNTDDKCIAILNVDAEYSNLIIKNKESMPFFRDLPHGASEILMALAE